MAGATRADLNTLYGSLLGRAPDDSGIATYTGKDVNEVRQSLLGSSEYAQRQQQRTNAPVDYAREQNAAFDALLDRQNKQQQGLFDQYTQKVQGQEQLPALYQRLQTEQGIPEITAQIEPYKTEIFRVKGLLDNLDQNVNSRNIGTYATQALRDRISASEGQGLRTDLSRLGTALEPLTERLTAAQGQVSALLPLYMQQQDRELDPLKLQISSLSERFGREITGFNSNRESMLNALLSKWERENQLSDREWELAQEIAAEERSAARASAQMAANIGQYLNAGGAAPAAPAPAAPAAPRPLPQALPSLKPGEQMLAPGVGRYEPYKQSAPGMPMYGDPAGALKLLTR